jgi:general secretion pathway protein G
MPLLDSASPTSSETSRHPRPWPRPRPALSLRRAAARGVTLIEIMIVIVIMGLLSGAVAAAVIPQMQQAKISTTAQNARALRQQAENWRATHDGDECPTFDRLKADGVVDRGNSGTDSWSNAFRFSCDELGVTVRSFGPDGKENTSDDIVDPKASKPTQSPS